MISLSRRSLLKAAARLGVGAGLALLGIGGERSRAQEESEELYFRESAATLTLGNQYYEVDLDKRNGAITRIFDKRGGGVVSEGNADGSLWAFWADGDGDSLRSAVSVPPSGFRWDWTPETGTLKLTYVIDQHPIKAQIQVSVVSADQYWFDMFATLRYESGPHLHWLSFPHDIGFRKDQIQEALMPWLPGILLQQPAFRTEHAYVDQYPGGNLAGDLTWIRGKSGTVAMYAVSPGRKAPARIGYARVQQQQTRREATHWRHQLALGISPDAEFTSPIIRITVSASLLATAADYRAANKIDAYPGLRRKARDVYETLRRSPLVLFADPDLVEAGRRHYDTYHDTFARLNPPALLHPVISNDRWFDEDQPDWWPPAERYGGAAAYQEAFSTAQRFGHLLMPYTNPTWWTRISESAISLAEKGIALEDIAARDADGEPQVAVHGWEGNPLPGVVVSPADPHVIERLTEIAMLHDALDHDLVLEDQHGARSWSWDYHAAASSPTDYAENWLEYMRQQADRRLMTEGGYDALAEVMLGFCGTQITWERFYAAFAREENVKYFPLSAAMFRDKTLLYQHDLEGGHRPTITQSLRMLRWNLAFGHQLNWDSYTPDNVWLRIDTAFSHYVLGEYADELLTDFRGDVGQVTSSVFESTTVTANWTDRPHQVGNHTLVPGGVVAAYHDGSVTGGVFQRYNVHDLTPGEHYLIEQRKLHGIVVRQPMGTDTPLRIRALAEWSAGLNLSVNAFHRNGELLHGGSARTRGGIVEVSCDTIAGGLVERRRFEGSITLGRNNVSDGIELVEPLETSIVVEQQGREARGFTSEEDWKPLSFRLTREISPSGSEVHVSVEYFDEVPVVDGQSDSLHLNYVSRTDSDVSLWHWDGADTGNQTWKTHTFQLNDAVFDGRQWAEHSADLTMWVAPGYYIGKVTVTNADELERRTVAYYTIHDPTQGETLTQGLHLRGWTDATQPIADLDLDGLAAIFAWDAEDERWRMYSPHVPTSANTLDTLEQGRAYYVRVANGQTLHWPEAPYGGVGFHLQPGRNLVCWLGTPDKALTDAIAPLRGMKAEPLVSIQIDGKTYDMEESRQATEPLPYGQALWVEINAVGPTRWLQF